MSYKKFGHGFWRVLFGFAFCLLFLLPLPLFSQAGGLSFGDDGSVTLSAEDYLAVVEEVQGLRTDLASLKQDNKSLKEINSQQADELLILRPQVKELKKDNENQATLLKTQDGRLKAQSIGLTELTTSWELQKNISIVGFTVGGISLLVNIGQAIAYQIK